MTALEVDVRGTAAWVTVGPVGAFTTDRGTAALVAGRQVAVFVLVDGSLHAIDNRDPISRANVLSRGIVGDRGGVPVVASPIYKQCYDLATGRCLDDPDQAVAVHEVRVVDDLVQVRLAAGPAGA
ncbi:MAG TPA: nitrite reductase small subunit NirD [Acidimicrobiales bacterium]|nr:nitrite reductase small subunit NirD [Acidimicrobiales bacterium]